jgi:cation:H+ antiporter
MAWIVFALSSTVLVSAAMKLTQYADVIAVRTRLGGMFIGTLLLAGATSLPELITALSSVRIGLPNLAAGNFFGSSMFNMFLLAVLDALTPNARILRRVAFTHALTAALAILLTGMVVFFMLANLHTQIGWVGVDSMLVVLTYAGGMRLIQLQGERSGTMVDTLDENGATHYPSLGHAALGFVVVCAVLVVDVPYMVSSAAEIARITGLGTGFVGAVLVAAITSLPELVVALTAVRIGAFDLAVGNLFGSNAFNMFALACVDAFYIPGRFLGALDPAFALVGLLGLLMTCLALIGNLARLERRLWFMELDALLLIVVYLAGIYWLYLRGIGL